ncbi:MAG TPA: alcohol dehydrogenase [Nitrososphaeraceae archaeon]
MKAARIIKPNEPLNVEEIELPQLEGSEVLVKVKSCGVCHSDIHLWEGGYQGPDNTFIKATDRGVKYPLTPGHEIAGFVEDLGEEARGKFNRDDKVIVYPWIGEGLCPACIEGEENLCDKPRSLGVYQDGGYAEYVLVPSYRYLVKLNNNSIELDVAATLPCSSLTAYNAVRNARLEPYHNLVIVGAGGLGLMAIQLAKAIFGARIIALDLDDNKLKVAKENGADIILNSKKEDPIKAIMELTSNLGVDSVIDFVNSTKSVQTDMQFLRRRAKLVLVGLYGGELKLNLISIPTKAHRIIGSYTGTLNELVGLLSLAERGVINPVVTDRFKLEEATKALSELKKGNIIGRGVINP